MCHAAGEDKCALWAESPAAIEERARAAIEALRLDPIPIADRTLVAYPPTTGVSRPLGALPLSSNYVGAQLYFHRPRTSGP